MEKGLCQFSNRKIFLSSKIRVIVFLQVVGIIIEDLEVTYLQAELYSEK